MDSDDIDQVSKLLPKTGGGGSTGEDSIHNTLNGARDFTARVCNSVVALFKKMEQSAAAVTEAVNETGSVLLVVKRVGKDTSEEQTFDILGFPVGLQGRELAAVDAGRHAGLVIEVLVEDEPGAVNDRVIGEDLGFTKSVSVVDNNIKLAHVVLGDLGDRSIKDGVLGLKLVSVEHVVVDGAQISDVVSLPGKSDGVGGEDVDQSGGVDEVVSSFETTVALADD